MFAWVHLLARVALEHSFQLQLESSGYGFERQLPHCILVVVGFPLLEHEAFLQPAGTDLK